MRDGATRKIPGARPEVIQFLARHEVSVVLLSGDAAGSEFELAQLCVTLGRGPGVDLAFEDSHLSRQHLAFDLTELGFTLRDLGSTNGVLLNGEKVEQAALRHGDRITVGDLELQYVVQERADAPTYVFPAS